MRTKNHRRMAAWQFYQREQKTKRGTVSGPGSTMGKTQGVRSILSQLLGDLLDATASGPVPSEDDYLVDVPCGDCHWMSTVDPVPLRYLGLDILPELIDANRKEYKNREFRVFDIVTEIPPTAQILVCRDCLQHLTLPEALAALGNIVRSRPRWFLTTSWETERQSPNRDRDGWGFVPWNLLQSPFADLLPSPTISLREDPHSLKRLNLYLLRTDE